MGKNICEVCGMLLSEDAQFCTECGGRKLQYADSYQNELEERQVEKQQQENVFCENCGQRVEVNSSFCTYCGTSLGTSGVSEEAFVQPEGEEPYYHSQSEGENRWNGASTDRIIRKKKSSKVWIVILISLVVLALVGGGTAFVIVTVMNRMGNATSEQQEEDWEEDIESNEGAGEDEALDEMVTEETEAVATEEFVAGIITLDSTVEAEIEELMYWYAFSNTNYNGGQFVATEPDLSSGFVVATLNHSALVKERLSGVSYINESYWVIEQEDLNDYLYNSINIEEVELTYRLTGAEAEELVGDAYTESLVVFGMGDMNYYTVYSNEMTEVTAISEERIRITGVFEDGSNEGLEEYDSKYRTEYEIIFRENPDSVWGGYTLETVVSWETEVVYEPSNLVTGNQLTDAYLTESMLADYSAEDLRIIRNEIYARHGYIFKDEELAAYFESKSWYVPTTDLVEESELNQYELANVELIKSLES